MWIEGKRILIIPEHWQRYVVSMDTSNQPQHLVWCFVEILRLHKWRKSSGAVMSLQISMQNGIAPPDSQCQCRDVPVFNRVGRKVVHNMHIVNFNPASCKCYCNNVNVDGLTNLCRSAQYQGHRNQLVQKAPMVLGCWSQVPHIWLVKLLEEQATSQDHAKILLREVHCISTHCAGIMRWTHWQGAWCGSWCHCSPGTALCLCLFKKCHDYPTSILHYSVVCSAAYPNIVPCSRHPSQTCASKLWVA